MAPSTPSYEAIDREFRAGLVRYFGRFVDADEARDLAQVTLMKVSGHLQGFRGESSVATWIHRIARNVALDRLRQGSLERASIPMDDPDEAAGADVPAELRAPSAETVAARNEMGECVREFVDRLPESYRSVLVLSDFEGFTNGEIADMGGLSLDNVKIRLHRARHRLQAELRAGCSVECDSQGGVTCDRKPPDRSR